MPVYSVKVPNGEIYQINAPEGASEDDILGFAQAKRRTAMNTKVIAIAALGTAGLLASVQALAHHSFAAEFDADKKLAMTGVVTKVEWTNPHVYFFIEVDADGGKFERRRG